MSDQPIGIKRRIQSISATFKGKRSNISRDRLWAAENLDLVDILPKDAPSALAWGLLQWGRENDVNRGRLYDHIMKAGKEDSDDRSRKIADDGQTAEQLIAEIRSAGIHALLSSSEQGCGEEPGRAGED